MSSCASFFILFLSFFLSSFRASAQNPSLLYSVCPNTTTYSRNSTYYNNLTTLLSFLSSRNASHSTGFENETVGQDPDKVTGLFLCLGGLSLEACRDCVSFSVNESLTVCPNQSEAVLYYDNCMLRYSNRDILSTVQTTEGYILSSLRIIPPNQQESFREFVLSLMNQAAAEAANSSRKFGTRQDNFTAFQRVYGLVQCTPDLTTQDCSRCLETSISQLPTENTGARILLPSCNSRYEPYLFYNESATSTLPSPSPPQVSTPPQPEDYYEWVVDGNLRQRYSTGEIYTILKGPQPTVPWATIVWCAYGIPRHSFLTWLVLLDRCPTRDRLIRWGMNVNPLCLLCNTIQESRNHLFFECSYSASVWRLIAARCDLMPSLTWESILHQLLTLRVNRDTLRLTLLATQAAIYWIWTERNKRYHQQIFRSPEAIFLLIDKQIRNRLQSIRHANPRASSAMTQLWFLRS
ncbi:Reverse transcriptase zinc-binding domain protein [Raphanus sativus]|nr:Reverse transcriptase zinc-binding domain protein [Raphanus sativus]